MYKIDCIEYPNPSSNMDDINGTLCYFIKPYDISTIMSLAIWKFEEYAIKILNKNGIHQDIDNNSEFMEYIKNNLMDILAINHSAKIWKSQLFFANNNSGYILIDLFDGQKFAGPGIIRDIYGKRIKTQEVLEVKIFDKSEEYKDVIIKPSKPKSDENNKLLYIKV